MYQTDSETSDTVIQEDVGKYKRMKAAILDLSLYLGCILAKHKLHSSLDILIEALCKHKKLYSELYHFSLITHTHANM